MAITLTVAAQKGGVGKTTSAITIASYLARKGNRVLLVDIDAQRNSTLVLLDNFKELEEHETVAAILRVAEDYTLSDLIHPSRVTGLDIVPSHTRLSEADVLLSQLMGRETRIRNLLSQVQDAYDYIFIDNPPNVNWVPINGLVASDYVLIPISPNAFDLEGISLLLKQMQYVVKYYNPSLKLLGFFVTMFARKNSISNEIVALLERQYPDLIFNTKIPLNTDIQKANAHRQDIFSFKSDATSAIAYKAFIEKELLPRLHKLETLKHHG
jgi:chromosome partitioning protein